MAWFFSSCPTPVGPLLLVADDTALTEIRFTGALPREGHSPAWKSGSSLLEEAARQLSAYFAGALRLFHLPLAPRGTPFQLRVWQTLQGIPYGETISYEGLARRVGRPSAARAVGAANGRNPLPIVIPCHRVLGKDGSLTGFRGGLRVKRQLLVLEGAPAVTAAFCFSPPR
ncbi:MAG: methylated-DNA--[protein]-cysteine S-methyltransferase [Acidobacteriota bacterium]